MQPTHRQILGELADAERRGGWLEACEEAGCFIRVTAELADAIGAWLRETARGPVLEVCAGRGELAAELRRRGCEVIGTDANPPAGSGVIRLGAAEALDRYRPTVVLGCFVPANSGVDRAVLAHPSVRDYLVVNARLGSTCGDDCLWNVSGWSARRLKDISDRLLTRHDVWLGPNRPVLRHGEAWHFRRDSRGGGAEGKS